MAQAEGRHVQQHVPTSIHSVSIHSTIGWLQEHLASTHMKSQIGSELTTTVYQKTLMKGKFDESGSHHQTKTTSNSNKYYLKHCHQFV